MNQLTKVLTAAAVAGATVLATSGCGLLASSSGGGGEGDGPTLTIWARPASIGENAETLLAQQFPDHDITVSRINDIDDKLRAGLRAGSGLPDIAFIGGNLSDYFAVSDQFVDFTEHGFTDDGRYVPWVLEPGQDLQGRQVALPTDIGPYGFFYRADAMEELGYPGDPEELAAEVSTWEDYRALSERAREADRFTCDAPYGLYVLGLSQQGYRYVDTDGGQPVNQVDSPVNKEAYDRAATMVQDDLCAGTNPYSAEWNSAIAQDSVVAFIGAGYQEGILKPAAGEDSTSWRVTATPGGPGSTPGSFVTALSANGNGEAAAEVAQFLASPEALKDAYLTRGLFPPAVELYEDPELLEGDPFYGGQSAFATLAGVASGTEEAFGGLGSGTISSRFRDALDEVHTTGRDPEEAYQEVVGEFSDYTG
ncbi:ABC transporter substrate-binding protein [Desertihabitans aurantiacus]|uniref:ABC transporter substrate-binding protein n=1 Tax=Desertihabitans aurantiacus TaxID=2282477 RepID=UPI00130024E0|nr:extracellular solute-binding protein [Desertihabitans aurantiacus]